MGSGAAGGRVWAPRRQIGVLIQTAGMGGASNTGGRWQHTQPAAAGRQLGGCSLCVCWLKTEIQSSPPCGGWCRNMSWPRAMLPRTATRMMRTASRTACVCLCCALCEIVVDCVLLQTVTRCTQATLRHPRTSNTQSPKHTHTHLRVAGDLHHPIALLKQPLRPSHTTNTVFISAHTCALPATCTTSSPCSAPGGGPSPARSLGREMRSMSVPVSWRIALGWDDA